MRQFKFRAWDLVNKKWLFGYEYPNLGGFSLTGETVILGQFSAEFRPLSRLNEIEITQWSGLKDRNNRDIYENDIVKYFGKWDDKGNVIDPDFEPHHIIWSMGGMWAIPVSSKFDSSPKHWKSVGHTTCEIMGNLYENSEKF